MKLSEDQKAKLIEAVEGLNTSHFWETCSCGVFRFEGKGGSWQLQVKITKRPKEFIEGTRE